MTTAEQIIEMNKSSFNNPEELKKLVVGLDRTDMWKVNNILSEVEDLNLSEDLRWLGILMYDSIQETL